MARLEATQLNIRSRFARERAAMLSRATGMTTTQVVEEALRAYLPPSKEGTPARLVRKGAILVRTGDGKRISLQDANAALDEARRDG